MDPNDLLDGDWDVHGGGFGSRHGTTKKLGFSTVKDFTTTTSEATSGSSSGNIGTPSGVGNTTNIKSSLRATTTSSYDTNNISSSHIAAAYNLSGMMDSDDDDDDDDDGIRSSAATNKHDNMAGSGGASNTSAGEILSTDLLQQQQNLLLNDQSRFLVEQIEFEFSKTFIQVCASKGNLLLVTDQNTCIYVDDDFERYREFKINVGDDDEDHERIHKCFIDPSGYHVLVSMTNGDNYYFNTQNNKNPKIPVSKLKNMIIESVGWDSETCNRDQTGPILIGTSDSKIYECSLENDLKEPVKSPLKLLFDFNDCDMLVSTGPITGIEIVYFPKLKNSFNCYLILIATRLRLFEFVGGPTLQDVFTPYKQSYDLLRYKELPAKRSDMLPKCGELHLFKPSSTTIRGESSTNTSPMNGSSSLIDQQQLSFAWLSNAGIFHGVLNFSNPNSRQPQSGVSVISESEVIQYDHKSASQVMSMAISEFHMFVLYPEKLQILMQPAGLCTAASNVANVASATMNPLMLNSLFMMNNNNSAMGMTTMMNNSTLYAGGGGGALVNNNSSTIQQDIEKFFQGDHPMMMNQQQEQQDLNLLVASLATSNVGEISLSDIRVVYSQPFPVSTSGELIGLCTDTSTRDRIIYLYSSSAVWRITIDDEEKDVWKLYLEQALDPKSSKESYFDIAYKLCKQDPKTKDIVLSAKADYYFKTGRYNEAANIYAMSSKSFEQVSIAFHNRGQKDALRIYVLSKLQILKKNIKTENQDATQLCCLCTWLTEMYLDKLNELYDLVNLSSPSNNSTGSSSSSGGGGGLSGGGGISSTGISGGGGISSSHETSSSLQQQQHLQQLSYEEQYKIAKQEFRDFLEQHKKYLNKETTFRLISSHGQTEEVIFFAMLIEDYERVISYCITEKDYKEALGILNKYCTTRQYEDYFYKFAPILMQHLPKETVNMLTQKRFLDSGKLIPALMRYISQQQQPPHGSSSGGVGGGDGVSGGDGGVAAASGTTNTNAGHTITSTHTTPPATNTNAGHTNAFSKKTSSSSQLTNNKPIDDEDNDEEFTDSLLDDEHEEEDPHISLKQQHSTLNENQHFSNSLTSEQQNHVIRYLEWCIRKQENEDPAIHNLLLTLYADLEDDEKLLTFLDTEGENNYYDPKYALRVCSQKKKIEACVRLYSSMQLFDDAVDLALENDHIELARECADKPEDDENKKKLWLKIAKHVINHNTGVKQAIEFLSYTDKIKLEDILPYFPDFSHIDDFKEEICKSLEQYKDEIEKLKSEMQEATQTASEIREDIKELKHRYGFITANATCDLSLKSVLTTDFYLFPCQHVFRADALVEEVLRHTKSKELREKLRQLEEKRKLYNRQVEMLNSTTTSTSGTTNNATHNDEDDHSTSSSQTYSMDQKELSQLQDELRELDEILSAECPLCGEIMINSIDESFISQEEMETSIYNSWSIA
ncbi:hypothetical protein FDP41_006500 [Naegleria fowleri]|uniref:Uncharacterized protein n=1 Tax=Naegleria fowleri TaxID=5763 RepID=A0A6A5BK06_NAEFO|nr:uncharacterized protein FDP41_006500 [Naegleria fowleri]KAF0974468.1 hypothetical protein FDP41_006500 [Naegleria fowleri]CAG4708579.1 unnamed protein product [Naegleria fowleri]